MAQQKFLEQRPERAFSDAEQRVVHGDLYAVTIAARIVEGRDAGRAEIPENVGVVGLPVTVVALADRNRRDGVQRADDDVAVPPVEVARVLVQQRRQQGGAKQGRTEAVAVGGSVPLRITGKLLAVAGEVALPLLDAGYTSGRVRIGDWLKILSDDFDAHRAGSAADAPGGSLDGDSVEVGHLLGGDLQDLLLGHLALLLLVRSA